jgi:galactokinase
VPSVVVGNITIVSIDRIEAGDPQQIARALAERFSRLHGRAPSGVFTAPGRVNLIGEHVDYNGGSCLPMAVANSTYAAVATRPGDVLTVTSLQQEQPWRGRLDMLGPGHVTGWPAHVAGVIWALQEDGWNLPGMDIVVDGRVPSGAGLSSSAALECSVALAAVTLASASAPDGATRLRLVAACRRAETEVVGAPTGGMDQTVSLLASPGKALLIDCQDWSSRDVPWDPAAAGLGLLVVDTRAPHSHADGGYASRRDDCEEAARLLGVATLREIADPEAALARLDDPILRRRTRHVLTEIVRVDEAAALLDAGDFAALGALLDLSHDSLRDDFEVSCPELDAVVDTARTMGALGARLTGGGFGGSAIALVPVSRLTAIEEAIHKALIDRGWRAPAFLTAAPAGRAHQVFQPR